MTFEEWWVKHDQHDYESCLAAWNAAQKAAKEAAPTQEPDWVSLEKQAAEIVRSKPTYKKFIDGTPLSNDVSVWMADFAMEHGIYEPADPDAAAQIAKLKEKILGLEFTVEMHELSDNHALQCQVNEMREQSNYQIEHIAKLKAAARMALDALEYHTKQTRPIHQTLEAIAALREALGVPKP